MSEKRRAFFVLHPEGSGGYMLTEALVAAGCHWEQWHESHHKDYKFDEMPSPFVFHRSLPHAGAYWNWVSIVHQMQNKAFIRTNFGENGFLVHVLPIIREPNAAAMSVANRDKDRDYDECFENTRRSLSQIGTMSNSPIIPDIMLTLITYEAFVHSEGFRRWLFEERLRLPYPEDFEVTDQNAKYYKEK